MIFYNKKLKGNEEISNRILYFRRAEAKNPKGDDIFRFRKSMQVNDILGMMVLASGDTVSNLIKDSLVESFERVVGVPLLRRCPSCKGYQLLKVMGTGDNKDGLYSRLTFGRIAYECVEDPSHFEVMETLTRDIKQAWRNSASERDKG